MPTPPRRPPTLSTILTLALLACGDDAATDEPDADPLAPDAAAAGEPDAAPAGALRLATGLRLARIEAFQTVSIALVDGDAAIAPRNAGLVAGRRTVLHLHVAPDADWVAAPVRAVAAIEDGTGRRSFEAEAWIDGPSVPGDFSTILQVDLPADAVAATARLAVALTTETGAAAPEGTPHPARWPRDGATAPLGALDDGGGLRLVLVPVRWDGDGSGRLPDLGPARLAELEALLRALYPLAGLGVTVREPLPWSDGLTWSGNVDFGDLNDALIDLRTTDAAPADAYYYAVVKPDDTFAAYCGGSCVTGQSYVVDDAADADLRVGSGVGFDGEDWTWTLAHELGHMHGRSHAPCDVSGSDPDYPYDGGGIGVWGLDPRRDAYLSPDVYADLMGYCDDTWISDYTYEALRARVVEVNALPTARPAPAPAPERYRVLRVGADGRRAWGRTIRRTAGAAGERRARLALPAEGGLPARTVHVALAREAHGGAIAYFVPARLAPPAAPVSRRPPAARRP